MDWPVRTVLRTELTAARDCHVIRFEPAPATVTAYASVTAWVDRNTLLPVRTVKTPRNGPVKEMLCRGFRQSRGHWVATQLEVRWEGRAGQTRLVFTAGSVEARVLNRELDPNIIFAATSAR